MSHTFMVSNRLTGEVRRITEDQLRIMFSFAGVVTIITPICSHQENLFLAATEVKK